MTSQNAVAVPRSEPGEADTLPRDFLEFALACLRHEPPWCPIPITPGTKKPLVKWKEFEKRRPTEQEVRAWAEQWPDAGCAVVCGQVSGGLIGLDLDPGHADTTAGKDLLQTPCCATPRGGMHLLFQSNGLPLRSGEVLPYVEVKAEGATITVPPTAGYEWLIGPETPLAPVPSWLLEAHTAWREKAAQAAPTDSGGDGEPIPEGQRHRTLVSLAGSMRRPGMTAQEIEAALAAVNASRCQPPLPEAEVREIARSVARYPTEQPPAETNAATLRPLATPWPLPLAEGAFHGLAGDFVRLIEPHTEADPAALLLTFLVTFGNVIGRGPHFVADGAEHYTNLNALLVGATAKGRKGSSLAQVLRPFKAVDADWASSRIACGLSSGEGMIWAVRDPMEKTEPVRENKRIVDYESVTVDPGVTDKRLLVTETEFASTLRVMGREGNTLSATIRQAWDTGNLRVLNKNSPAQATGAHISILGHITGDEVRRYFDTTEAGNGFGNRFLWACVKRSKLLPEGGRIHEVDFAPAVQRLRKAVEFARTVGEMTRDEQARSLWHEVYARLSEGWPGLLGAVIARAEAQVMRLACIYALLDMSDVVRREHLEAALTLWRYCEDSARFNFGDALGYPVADAILRALRQAEGGMTRTEINRLFAGNRAAHEIERALRYLEEHDSARCEKEAGGEGRPAERWHAVRPGGQV
jgi:hypothetical protein